MKFFFSKKGREEEREEADREKQGERTRRMWKATIHSAQSFLKTSD